MAVYNGSAYLKESIDSVLNQTFKDFELLIINDGSTDNSVDIINSYSDSRIRLLHNYKNEGLIFTRNRSVKEARGKYLAILDCDDIALPNRLQLQYDYLQNNPNIALCGGYAQYIDHEGKNLNVLTLPLDNLQMEMLFLNVFINSSLMIRTEAIKKVGGYSKYKGAGDFDLSLRIAEHYKVANLDKVLVKYRIHQNNMSNSQNDMMTRDEISIIRDMHNRLSLKSNDELVDTHHTIYVANYQKYPLSNYKKILENLKEHNTEIKKFDIDTFNKFLYTKWYEILRSRGDKNVLIPYLSSGLFYCPAVKFKHIRKIFKQSVGIK